MNTDTSINAQIVNQYNWSRKVESEKVTSLCIYRPDSTLSVKLASGIIVLVMGVAACVQAAEDAVSEQRVVLHLRKNTAIHTSSEGKEKNHMDKEESYPSYEFFYKVKDPHTRDIKGQHEERDGDKVKGNYWLIEPTGRKRTVKYHSDDHIGFNANVDFSENGYPLHQKDQNEKEEHNEKNNHQENYVQNYEVTEIIEKEEMINLEKNEGNENNNEQEKNEPKMNEQKNINNEENELKNQEENIVKEGNNSAEKNKEETNNENKVQVADAGDNNEALNEKAPQESDEHCKCNERHKKDHGSQINNKRRDANSDREMRTRSKRRNNDRGVNSKKINNLETLKTIESDQKNYGRSRANIVKKNIESENLNDAEKKFESSDYGKRTHEVENSTVKESDPVDQNENEDKYQHRILIHHPKNVKALAKRN
ncbi:GATA zinc finger domain-containing protein 14-like [Danaus plexippus]|uniref:GATA zinc finger domain-containing protein 14-like n=1 Tax=Danaus plexippus TaxID=13037 RepID=UPI002AB091C7|nr:GATA zinc finger domain-containing protein 14-like [Danaus plexippus]